MIQDIYPSRLQNEYKDYVIRDEDNLLTFDKDGKILIRDVQGKIEFLKVSDVKDKKAIYLFGIDDKRCYYFEASGYTAVSKYVDGCWVGADGAWVK